MSDLDGERAFDMITERMLDLNTRLDAASRERYEAQRKRSELEGRVQSLERQLRDAQADAAKFKALVPPRKLAAAEAGDDVPF